MRRRTAQANRSKTVNHDWQFLLDEMIVRGQAEIQQTMLVIDQATTESKQPCIHLVLMQEKKGEEERERERREKTYLSNAIGVRNTIWD
jgi:hypothetical protein